MTDERYTFVETVRERKELGRSARSKVSGAKSKTCRLSTDYMTAAELKRRNGKIMTYNLSKPMCWEDFKRLPKDLQTEYIVKLRDEFGITGAEFAEMTGVEAVTLRTYLGRTHPDETLFPRGKRPRHDAMRQAWLYWSGGKEAPTPEPQAAPDAKKQAAAALIVSGSLNLAGTKESVLRAIDEQWEDGASYAVYVSWRTVRAARPDGEADT